MEIIAKTDELLDRYVKRFRDALDISDLAIYAVHRRVTHNAEFYSSVFFELTPKERGMIKDAVARVSSELPPMLPNGRAFRE